MATKSDSNGTFFDGSLKGLDLNFLKDSTLLITGGTGSFGRRFTEILLAKTKVKKIIIFSRDEFKQSGMAADFAAKTPESSRLRYFLGDVRDPQRLRRAFHGVDFVVHAAALKQVPKLEYDPFEAVQTNILGAENIINAAIDQGVRRVLALSTDKAANPINLYGATKLCAEKLFVAGNSYASGVKTRFTVARYGNVVGSRGSVIPLYQEKRKEGVLPITDPRMTRFWITLDQGVELVLNALSVMQGGEIFVPKIASMRITDLAAAMAPECKTKVVGIRPGEKLHETLLTEDEATRSLDMGPYFLIEPSFPFWDSSRRTGGKKLPEGYHYASDTNTHWLTDRQLREMIGEPAPAAKAPRAAAA